MGPQKFGIYWIWCRGYVYSTGDTLEDLGVCTYIGHENGDRELADRQRDGSRRSPIPREIGMYGERREGDDNNGG